MVALPTTNSPRIASVASIATLPPIPGARTVPITGTTTITSIPAGAKGQFVTLEFQSAGCTVTNGSNLKLVADFISTPLRTLTLECDGTNWVEVGRSMPDVPLGATNAAINGTFAVAQRGTSFAAAVSGNFTLDRWQWAAGGAGVVTITQDTDVPTVAGNAYLPNYSHKVAVTTADASIASTDIYAIYQIIEGYRAAALVNGCALSFWVKSPKTGTHCVSLVNGGADRSYIAEYTVNAQNTWEYKTITFPAFPGAGTWNYTTGKGVYLQFALAAGSTYQTTANAWQTGNFVCSANQVNCMDSNTNVFRLALVNLIPGVIPQPLIQPDPAIEKIQCQRYLIVYGGQGTTEFVTFGQVISTSQAYIYMMYTSPMGGTPTITVSSASHWAVFDQTSGNPGLQACTSITAFSSNYLSTHAFGVIAAVSGTPLTLGSATAMVANNTANARIYLAWNP